jgi:hypothetical protein
VLVYRNGTLVEDEPDEIATRAGDGGGGDDGDATADEKGAEDDAHAE